MTSVLVLVDGFHTQQLLESLNRLLPLRETELLLVYVQGPASRAGLDLVRRRPGGHRLPPHREHEVSRAELAGADTALAEAAQLASSLASRVETKQVRGEPGHAICDLALVSHSDLIAIRAPGSLGPVGRYVTDHSPCPVLLMRGRA
jgi:nucleotide-binding universal stress UspA family protein